MCALSVKRSEDFSRWYQAAVIEADLAERSSVRGCMVIKPWGYSIWENMQSILDRKFKELGVRNCYFPLFIPVDLFAKETEHIEGFAKEMAIVTHSKLEKIDGKLVPTGPIEVPLAVRPTSEMIIGESFAKWVKSHRDLPLLVNQWCNVVRWEMRTRLFLRTMEFLWQEGHTAHETSEEATEFAKMMHGVYNWFITDILKIPAIMGKKPDYERFPGAVNTYTMEAMMQDGKALQAATSHYLGQTFSKAVGIQFQGRNEQLQFAYTSSWGISTRIIGGLIMTHGDDEGINTPISISPYHIVIIPIIKDEMSKNSIFEYCEKIRSVVNGNYRVLIDKTDELPQNKKWDYIRKGVPIICEIGERDVSSDSVLFHRRQPNIEKLSCRFDEFEAKSSSILQEHDNTLYKKALAMNEEKTIRNIRTIEQAKEFFESGRTGFVVANWKITKNDIEQLYEMGVSVRCSLIDSPEEFILAKAY
ncbi:MAG: proline--tRNA ligase [Holosporales bacterium]|jgi:prolyl-tRNA synthetase|nr:proline--tRNA ligase [Holosporales bacterium]